MARSFFVHLFVVAAAATTTTINKRIHMLFVVSPFFLLFWLNGRAFLIDRNVPANKKGLEKNLWTTS
jgi:hypothetical protein